MAAAATETVASSWTDMLGGVVWESKRIVAAHTRHFLALSVLFLLPLSLLLVAAPTFRSSLLHSDPSSRLHPVLRSIHQHHDGVDHLPAVSSRVLAFYSLYAAVAALLSLCAVAAVTHSVRHGFFGRSVRLLPALRSLPSSLWYLVLTLISAALIFAAYLALVASLLLLCLRALPLLGIHHQVHHLSRICYTTAAAGLALGLVYLQVNWALAGVIAVAESSWGLQPLRRSAHLVRGMRWAALCLALFFSAGVGLMLWVSDLGGAVDMKDWGGAAPIISRVVFTSAVTMVLFLYSLVSNTVLYMYCKALHGELASEIAEEFAYEYVCLPFDHRKVPHVVSVVWQ